MSTEIASVSKRIMFFPLACFVVSTLLFHTARISVTANADAERKAYIVYMGERKHNNVDQIRNSHHEMLASVLGSKEAAMDSMIYSYRHGFSGFAAKMTESQAKYFQGLAEVVKVFPNGFYKGHTTRSMDFLGLSASNSMNYSTNNQPKDASQGEGIVALLDSGITPESQSFDDKGLGPVPSRWKGVCQSGDGFNASIHCNKKIIGARYFIKGLQASLAEPFNARQFGDYRSPRDAIGHGTHCASTAGGSFVTNVSIDGIANGTARGGAPRARLAIYKVLWQDTATDADILKAYDMAIHDGVDVLSLSLGKELPLRPEVDSSDSIDYGAFHAVARGITVVSSGGNSGPKYQTIGNVAPWVITVGASTLDRALINTIWLGDNQVFTGHGMYVGGDTGFVNLAISERQCEDISSDEGWMNGNMVLCFTVEGNERDIIVAANNVAKAGGLGLIATLKNFVSMGNFHRKDIPVILVTYDVATQILKYISFNQNPKVRVNPTKTYIGRDASTYIWAGSSRGPNSVSPGILKPDIAAPGVDILAAAPPNSLMVSVSSGYAFASGTSMACPHIAGIVALLKSFHPTWSPAAIKSALVTTAWIKDPYSGEPIYSQQDTPKIANPFDYGGGLVNANAARDPGLVYDIGTQDYINYLCAMGYPQKSIDQLTRHKKACPESGNSVLNLNLPSITVPNIRDSVTLTRTVTNVGDPNSKYQVVIEPPQGSVVKVSPMYLLFNPKIKKMSFNVTITTSHEITTEYYFGSLTWTDKIHNVRIPISMRSVFPISI